MPMSMKNPNPAPDLVLQIRIGIVHSVAQSTPSCCPPADCYQGFHLSELLWSQTNGIRPCGDCMTDDAVDGRRGRLVRRRG